jgi:hypothetical protein
MISLVYKKGYKNAIVITNEHVFKLGYIQNLNPRSPKPDVRVLDQLTDEFLFCSLEALLLKSIYFLRWKLWNIGDYFTTFE